MNQLQIKATLLDIETKLIKTLTLTSDSASKGYRNVILMLLVSVYQPKLFKLSPRLPTILSIAKS